MIEELKAQLKRHEGEVKRDGRHVVYDCPAGYPTIGWGRNLEGRGLSDEEAEMLLGNDIEAMKSELLSRWPWLHNAGEVRFAAFVNLAFNMGIPTLAKFKNTLAAAKAGNWELCGEELIDSRWYRQVGDRGREIVMQVKTGEWQ